MMQKGDLAMQRSWANDSHWSSSNMTAIGHRACAQDLVNKRVDCSSRRLTEVPPDLYPDVQRLNLKLNNLTTLRNMSFQFYFKLEDIIIGSANIHYIEGDTFRPLKNLKYLELWNNPSLQFSTDIVQWSSELILLNLLACRLKVFDFGVLNILPKLERLDLSSNKISIISHESHGSINMMNDFSSRITTHRLKHELQDEGGFMANSSLMNNPGPNIILEGNPIQMVNPDTIALLCGNKLTLGGYPLSTSVIKNISLGISKSKIESLMMKSSGIRNISSEMFEPLRNTSLAFLGLLGNRLILYPFVFANLRRLSELDINTCGLTVLQPEYFYGMSALRKLNLDLNNFLSLNPYNATWDINVSKLDLLLSYVEKINEYTFKGLHDFRKTDINVRKSASIKYGYN